MFQREETNVFRLNIPEKSEWSCYLFGGKPGTASIVWYPEKGKEPNRFWRWMQYICFGNRWVKE